MKTCSFCSNAPAEFRVKSSVLCRQDAVRVARREGWRPRPISERQNQNLLRRIVRKMEQATEYKPHQYQAAETGFRAFFKSLWQWLTTIAMLFVGGVCVGVSLVLISVLAQIAREWK